MHTASPQSGTQWANLVADHGVNRRVYGTPTVQVTGSISVEHLMYETAHSVSIRRASAVEQRHRHLIEHPMPAFCSAGPAPVAPISRIASYSSRRVPSGAVSLREASKRPR